MLREFTGSGIDDTAALMALVASATPQDKIRLYGKCVTSHIFSPPCSWGGASPFESQLVALAGSGATSSGLASIADRSGISVTDIGLVGEGVYYPAATPFGLAVGCPTMAATDQLVENVTFSQFNAGQWIDGGAAAPCNGLRIRKSHFISSPSDYPGTGPGGTFVYLQSGAGFFTNGEIDGNIMDGTGVAFGVALFGHHLGYITSRNQISNIGLSVATGPEPTFGPGRYAITIYNTDDAYYLDASPTNGMTLDNLIINPAEIGVYAVSGSHQTITGNRIVGQYGTSHIESLGRGAIVVGSTNGALISRNDLEDNLYGITIGGACWDIAVLGNRIVNRRDSSPVAFFSDGTALSANANLTVAGNDIQLSGGAGVAFGGTVTGSGNILVVNNTGRVSSIGGGGTYAGANVTIQNPFLA
jgi:hypothetical protein